MSGLIAAFYRMVVVKCIYIKYNIYTHIVNITGFLSSLEYFIDHQRKAAYLLILEHPTKLQHFMQTVQNEGEIKHGLEMWL